jgi:hypothetical protein
MGSLFQFMERQELNKYRSKILHELRLNAGLDTDEQEVDEYGDAKKDAQGRPMVDEFGNPAYKKTYSLNDDQRKKIMGDAGRE